MARSGQMLAVGDRAVEFEIRDLNGGRKSLKDLLGTGPALIAFFKVSCPVCQFTFPFLERLHRAKVNVFGISQDDASSTRDFNEEFGISFPVLLDERGYPASNGFGITHVPSLFLVEPDSVVSWVLEGFSKQEFERVGSRLGAAPFKPGENVPEWKAG